MVVCYKLLVCEGKSRVRQDSMVRAKRRAATAVMRSLMLACEKLHTKQCRVGTQDANTAAAFHYRQISASVPTQRQSHFATRAQSLSTASLWEGVPTWLLSQVM
jgi:Tfp pilus assembly protein PilE